MEKHQHSDSKASDAGLISGRPHADGQSGPPHLHQLHPINRRADALLIRPLQLHQGADGAAGQADLITPQW